VATILAELRVRLVEVYGDRMVHLVLFGSQARGDAVVGSDIDVLIVLRGGVEPWTEISRTSDIAAEISLRHDVVVSRVFVSLDRYLEERTPLLMNVRREGVLA
jgi:predicted nucleotidyltransferase